jgi:formamidopyrimidine-DNA glycosylase
MPELPEVETVVRGLRDLVRGKRLGQVRVWRPEIIESDAREFETLTSGRSVQEVARRGKWIEIHLEGGLTVLAHLRMTGRFSLVAAGEPRGHHDHLEWPLPGLKSALRFADIRRFGRFRLLPTVEVDAYLDRRGFGPEPFAVTCREFSLRLGQGIRPIKSALLDQRVVAGIGNIYADEILFASRIHPRTPVRRLSQARRARLHACMQSTLHRAIAARGTTLVNFAAPDGLPGGFASQLQVFRRTGEPCFSCGRAVSRLRLAGRSTHYCGRCQRP